MISLFAKTFIFFQKSQITKPFIPLLMKKRNVFLNRGVQLLKKSIISFANPKKCCRFL